MSTQDTVAKMKVLGLQELTEVAGGRMAEVWSTPSAGCRDETQWSTNSNDCELME